MANDLKLELVQVFDAPLDKVWDAWTNIDKAKQWSGPEGMFTPIFEIDPRVGGKYRMVMQPEGTDENVDREKQAIVGGEYLEIEDKKKLVYTWLWEGQNPETHTTTVTLLFKELEDGKTELTLVHSGFVDENMVHEHAEGWKSTLRKFVKFIEK